MTAKEIWDAIGGADSFGKAIRDAARKNGVTFTPRDIAQLLAEIEKQFPAWIADAQREAETVAQSMAQRQYRAFFRQIGAPPPKNRDQKQEKKPMSENLMFQGKSVQYWRARTEEHGVKSFADVVRYFEREHGMRTAHAQRVARKSRPDLFNRFMAGKNPRVVQRF